jgi:hypothetical protein
MSVLSAAQRFIVLITDAVAMASFLSICAVDLKHNPLKNAFHVSTKIAGGFNLLLPDLPMLKINGRITRSGHGASQLVSERERDSQDFDP